MCRAGSRSGQVRRRCVRRHNSAEFVRFLDEATRGYGRTPIHVIVDNNLSAHKTAAIQARLAKHTRVQLYYTPPYSSWLNQVERWFSTLARDCIERGIFTSTRNSR